MRTSVSTRFGALTRNRGLLCVIGLAAVALPALAQSVERGPFPLQSVRAGLHGTGYTVVSGTEPEPFQVEILGVLHDVFPKQDLIVARLTGLGLEQSGVMAGMSGSPVYVDGRILGAVAYRLIDFGREAIAGIVPIESMLAVGPSAGEPAAVTLAVPEATPGGVLARAAALLTGKRADAVPMDALGAGKIRPIATPVAISGVRPSVIGRLRPLFESFGWLPVAGGVAASGEPLVGDLQPGGVVAVQLMRGDINVSASGTVTYRDGDLVYAFGHPFLQGGAVDFPMVGARVITVLSSAAASRKLTSAGTEVLGAVRQDRLAAIMGRIGAQPRLVPVQLLVQQNGHREQLHFEIVADKILTPLYLFVGVVNGVQSLEKVYGEGSIQMLAEFSLADGRQIRLEDLFASQNQAVVGLSSNLAAVFGFLFDNAFEPVRVRSVKVDVALRDDRRVATIERVWVDRSRVRPGDRVTVSVALHPYRRQQVIRRIVVQVPESVQAGRLDLLVGDAEAAGREELGRANEPPPRDLSQLIRRIQERRRSDRVYVMISRAQPGAVVGGQILPALPPSVMSVLSTGQSQGDVTRLPRAILGEWAQPVDYVVQGAHRLSLQVLAR